MMRRPAMESNKEDGTCRGRLLGVAAAAAFFLVFFVFPVLADYEAGKRAWDAGKVAEAVAQWQAAADGGDPRAMLELGRLYVRGLGVPQSYVHGHMWFNLAASRGDAAALKERDALAAKMTPQQIATAQERALSWRPGMTEGGERGGGSGAAAGSPPPRAIREAQGLLGKLGYEPGPADGVWGGRSAKAYGSFLRDAGMAQSGTLTPEGLRALRAAAGGGGTGAGTGVSADPAPRQPVAPAAPALPRDALHRAVKAGDIDGLKGALKGGAEVDARDGSGWTALMHAANRGYKLMVGPLLEARADVNVQAADGATALFMAVVRGHSEIISLLMKAGADVSLKGPQGKTVLDVAWVRGDRAIVRALVARMAGTVGGVFKDCAECPEMVVLPAGEFMMGSRHRVTIRTRIAVGKYEVTRGEYERFVQEAGRSTGDRCRTDEDGYGESTKGRNWSNPGFSQGDREPAVCVSWEDAQSYVGWLSVKTGEGYRLLSEAEWEYAARAGTETRYSWGDEIGRNRANCDGCGSRWDDKKTAPVGSFEANGYGLHDMHGNVWEWVEDCWHENYSGAPTDGGAWTTGGDCGIRVFRGGSWNNQPWALWSADRNRNWAGDRFDIVGFRIARTLAP